LSVYSYLMDKLEKEGAIHFTLIDPDPEKSDPKSAAEMASMAEECGTSAIMVG